MDLEGAAGTGAVWGEGSTAPEGKTLGITKESSSLQQMSVGIDKSLKPMINSEIKQGEGKDRVLSFF